MYVLRSMQQKEVRKMNMNKLRAKIVEREMNVEDLAEMIGMTGATLYRKLRAPLKITISEAIQMKDVLKLTDEEALDIFLF